MADFFASHAASFDEPVALLMACHDRVRHYANLVQKLAAHIQENGADQQARDAAVAIMRYFDVAAPLHHQDEDDDLFPLLFQYGDDALREKIAAITAEHAELGALWQQVRACQSAIAEGSGTSLPGALAETFARRYPAHAGIEDEQIYPLAEKLLSAAELAELGRRMSARRGVVIPK